MEWALFSSESFPFLLRWFHFLAGITWIGVLYYFNFIQGSFFKEATDATKSESTQKLVPRALWWFRWGAMFTFLTGWLIIMVRAHQIPAILSTAWGIAILTGGIMGTLMWFNVWFVIWPAQKVVIASASQVAGGGKPIDGVAERAARALTASRTNVLLSIPMLFLMGAASHLPLVITTESLMPLVLSLAVLLFLIEFNALKGKTGPLTTVKGVITSGFALTAVVYVLMEILTK